MQTAVILAAGEGTKIWPYAEIRPKAMIPVAGKPIVSHQVELLEHLGFTQILIVGGKLGAQIRNYFFGNKYVQVLALEKSQGTAFTLCAAEEAVGDRDFLVLYGDTLLDETDILRLMRRFDETEEGAVALVSPLGGHFSQDSICCSIREDRIDGIAGHPRHGSTHRFCAFAFRKDFWPFASANSGIFSRVQVGMMPPLEGYLEMSLADYSAMNRPVTAVEAASDVMDIDKPWHILQANRMAADKRCGALRENLLAEGASIHPTAIVNGFVSLGRESRIGKNVIVEGNLIAGDHTVIENGAILKGNHIIGSHSYIGNYCILAQGAIVGSHCIISHCAELSGMIMDTVYLYHYMEFDGIIGNNTDLGAATVCGNLRFDDRLTAHRINGRREQPEVYANAVYLGDYVRTGVNTILMPGCKVGVYSIVGAGVLLNEDVPNGTIVTVKQELSRKEWGPGKYGW